MRVHPQLLGIVERLKRTRRSNPAVALPPAATLAADVGAELQPSAGMSLRMELQVAIVQAGIAHELTERELAWAADELDVDLGSLCEELASWL